MKVSVRLSRLMRPALLVPSPQLMVAEKLETVESFRKQPELTLVPSFMTQAIAIVPNGAWPGSCWPYYEIDYPAVEEYMDTTGSLDAHMAKAPELVHA